MSNLIDQTFEIKSKKIVTFVTGGDPDFETSNEIIKKIAFVCIKLKFYLCRKKNIYDGKTLF